jgi:hypothetical protein
MSTFTKDNTEISWEIDGGGEQRKAEEGGMDIALERWKRGLDTAEYFKDLPDGACWEQHWGYIISGSITMRYNDGRTETLSTGQAYYIAPGHNAYVDEDVELVEFTPSDQQPDRKPSGA